jgi:hypothetical protein
MFAGALFYVSYVGYWVSLPSFGGLDMYDPDSAIFGIMLPDFITIQLLGWGLQAFSIYLVIIWSRQHNQRFDQPAGQAEPSA